MADKKYFPKPPPAAKTSPIWVTSVDESMFEEEGTLKFNFSDQNGNIGPNHLNVTLLKYCEDLNFWWWPFKDCRVRASLTFTQQAYYYDNIPGLHINKFFVFAASLNTIWTKNNPECLWVDITIEIFPGTDVMGPVTGAGSATGPFGLTGQLHIGSIPVYHWTASLQFRCKDCILSCIPDRPLSDRG